LSSRWLCRSSPSESTRRARLKNFSRGGGNLRFCWRRFGCVRSGWLVSLRQREWDRTHSHKQKEIKSASDKMRFDGGIDLFFHLVLSFFTEF
jgi:hypothetical protein